MLKLKYLSKINHENNINIYHLLPSNWMMWLIGRWIWILDPMNLYVDMVDLLDPIFESWNCSHDILYWKHISLMYQCYNRHCPSLLITCIRGAFLGKYDCGMYAYRGWSMLELRLSSLRMIRPEKNDHRCISIGNKIL